MISYKKYFVMTCPQLLLFKAFNSNMVDGLLIEGGQVTYFIGPPRQFT